MDTSRNRALNAFITAGFGSSMVWGAVRFLHHGATDYQRTVALIGIVAGFVVGIAVTAIKIVEMKGENSSS